MIRVILTWAILFSIEVFGIYAGYLLAIGWWRPYPHAPIAHVLCGLLLYISPAAAFFVIFLAPVWISGSCLRVKRTIEDAQRNNYEKARFYFCNHRWIIFPMPKYIEIIRILRHLSQDRKTKPSGMAPELSQYIIQDDSGNYGLSREGKEKMISIVDTGWLAAKKAEDMGSPKTIKILMGLVAVVAIIRGIALIIHMVIHQ
jgi:hypothetical protein